MLTELDIPAYKLLRDTTVAFGAGMTAITGETGVGKSMLLGALSFLLGEKVGDEVFARDVPEVKVTGTFVLDPARPEVQSLITAGIWDPGDEPEFLLERSVARGGRSRAFLNGRRLSLGVLQQIGEALIDILGQNQVRYLTRIDPADLLDGLGEADHQALRESMRTAFRTLKEARLALATAKQSLATAAERRTFLEYQHQELQGAKLHAGEEATLTAEQQRLASITDLRLAAGEAASLLTDTTPESTAAYDALAQVLDRLNTLADLDADWKPSQVELAGMLEQIQDLAQNLSRYADGLEADPARLAAADRRIQQLESLKRKFRVDFPGLLELRDQVAAELSTLEGGDEEIAHLEKAVIAAEKSALAAASKLHKSRVVLAPVIGARLVGHLNDLNLAHARVEFRVDPEPSRLSATGHDHVELLLATAPREALQPFQQIASGGEVTRLALAFKALQAFPPGQSMLVVDEGDLGIGGDTAFQVGAKFRELSHWQQVLVVSHLAQVAASAELHLAVSRDPAADRITITSVTGEARVAELSRMLGDRIDPAAARDLAASYLREAQPVG